MSKIPEELITAYLNTSYKVESLGLVIRIGERNEPLDSLLLKAGVTSGAFISASNPYSKQLSAAENNSRHIKLKQDLSGYEFYEGYGEGDDKKWEREISFLILGVERERALFFARRYEQNAFVFLESGTGAALVYVF